jgi:5,10-methylenetetrahydromethanopterin reductase
MDVGFFFWPYTRDLVERIAERADRYGYAMIGIADTPGNAMDPWLAAALVARATSRVRVAICVTNLLTRHPSVSAAAVASLDHISDGRARWVKASPTSRRCCVGSLPFSTEPKRTSRG